jgi:hypothetical protein
MTDNNHRRMIIMAFRRHEPTGPVSPVEPCESCGTDIVITTFLGGPVAVEVRGTKEDGTPDMTTTHRHYREWD